MARLTEVLFASLGLVATPLWLSIPSPATVFYVSLPPGGGLDRHCKAIYDQGENSSQVFPGGEKDSQ